MKLMNSASSYVYLADRKSKAQALKNRRQRGDADPPIQTLPAAQSSSRGSGIGARVSKFFGFGQSQTQAGPTHASSSAANDVLFDELEELEDEAHEAIDTNVISLKLGSLASKADQLATGDPVFCGNEKCKAVLSSLSKVEDVAKAPPEAQDENKKAEGIADESDTRQVWTCEFCGKRNIIELEPEEMPQGESQDYIIEAAPNANLDADAAADDRSVNIVFCMDVSGSMCVSMPYQGKIELKGSRLSELSTLNTENAPQHFRANEQHVTYISRLQSLQAAVEHQMSELKKSHPKHKVGLVTFSREVCVIGDAAGDVHIITGDKLHDLAKLQEAGKKIKMARPIEDSYDDLSEKLFELEESGPTALGPALVIAVAMASQVNGSKVILCTDGLANIGLGALDMLGKAKNDDEGDELLEQAQNFYEGVGNFAQLGGVMVDILSITDEQCSLENLGRVADMTRGKVDRVDPLKLTDEFVGILAKPAIATRVSATMLLHHGMVFKPDDTQQATSLTPKDSDPKSDLAPVQESGDDENKEDDGDKLAVTARMIKDIGNASEDTEVFFEYQVDESALEKFKDDDGLESLPFQVQIFYTRLDGSRCVRVVSQQKKVTFSEEEAAKGLDVPLMAANAAQKLAGLAKEGDYERSRAHRQAHMKYFERNCVGDQLRQVGKWRDYTGALESNIVQHQQMELNESLNLRNASLLKGGKLKQKKARSSRRDDVISKDIYAQKQVSSAGFM